MRSPYSLSSSVENPTMEGNNKTNPSSPPPARDFVDRVEERNPKTALSMAAAAEALKSEYEHWEELAESAPGGSCQPGCSNGTEAVTALSEAVTEVFDLINEVAFPESIDLAKEEEKQKETKPACDDDGSTYNEDDDSMFNRSDEYNHNKQAKEFLGFIGAVKIDTKNIIAPPSVPPSLLAPDGMSLNLSMDNSSLLMLEESITHHSNLAEEEDSYESVTRNTKYVASNEDDKSVTKEHKTSAVEELLKEENDEEEQKKKYQICSVYDDLYPADSIFSFTTKDETESLFDFSESTNPSPESGTLEPPNSVILSRNSIEESVDREALEDYKQVEVLIEDEEERDQLQEERGEEEMEVEENVFDTESYRESVNDMSEVRNGGKESQEERDTENGAEERKDDERVSGITSMFVSMEYAKRKEQISVHVTPD